MASEPERTERFVGTGVNRKHVVTIDTGIYLREESTYTQTPADGKEPAERLDDICGEPSSLDDHLTSCERCAESALTEHGLTWPWTDGKPTANGDAINAFADAVRDAAPIVRVAAKLLWDIRGLRQDLGKPHPDPRVIAWTAYEIGRRAEMLGVIPFETFARSGILSKRGSIKGGQTRDKSDLTWQSKVETKMRGNRRSHTDVCEEIGRQSGVTGRTVRKHTSNPRPKKIRK